MKVEMIHNPYQGSLQILVNGQSRPSLESYAYKPFSVWYRDIFKILDGETNEPYDMMLMSDTVESDIIQALCLNTKYCRNISLESFPVSTSLESRISNIERAYHNHSNIPVQFFITPSLENKVTQNDIQRLCKSRMFSNNLWDIQCNFCDISSVSNNPALCEYLYIIAGNENELGQQVMSSARKGYYSEIYCVIPDGRNNVNYIGNYLTMHSPAGEWSTALQKLMKCTVIGDCFSVLYNSFPEQLKGNSAFQVKERPKIMFPEFVEEGSQVDILVIASSMIPELDIVVRNPSVLKSSGRTLIGVSKGITNVQVFEKGTHQLLAAADIEVKFIPRIRELYPDDVSLRHGEVLELEVGQSAFIPYSYGPANSENVKNIRWYSDNTAIVKIDALSGKIEARRSGVCTVSCEADNVGFFVPVDVIPVPEKIEVSDLYRNEIVLNVGEYYELKASIVPENAHYGNISVEVSDADIVRAVNNRTIEAVGAGITNVIVSEDLHGVSTSVVVRVIEVKKAGFFSRFFKK